MASLFISITCILGAIAVLQILIARAAGSLNGDEMQDKSLKFVESLEIIIEAILQLIVFIVLNCFRAISSVLREMRPLPSAQSRTYRHGGIGPTIARPRLSPPQIQPRLTATNTLTPKPAPTGRCIEYVEDGVTHRLFEGTKDFIEFELLLKQGRTK